MPHIALVTAVAARHLDEDLVPLEAALLRFGTEVTIACWDDETIEWSDFDAAVLRSAWDYPQRLTEFLVWVDRTATGTLLLNTPETIRWNADKAYLADLARCGVPTVPTWFAPPRAAVTWPDAPEFVVKPSISAGSRDTARFEQGDVAATALVERIWATGRTVMLQPYLDGVDIHGEHALVFFDGHLSHAFRKGALLRPGTDPTEDLFAAERIDPARAAPDQVDVARSAIDTTAAITGDLPLYARVDLVPLPDGTPAVLELELIEPSVYVHTSPGSADTFARAIMSRLRSS